MGLTFSAIFAISFILSLGGTAAMRRVSTKLGFVDHPADRKLHTKPTPLGGGLAILAATMLTLLTCYAGLLYLRRQEPLSLSQNGNV